MFTRKFIFVFFISVLLFTITMSQNKVGTTAANFLKIGVGAKPMAMGGAVSSVINDASALYWNPAGLIELSRMSVMVSYTKWFADISHQYFGFAIPIDENNRIGLSANILTMDKIEITTERNPAGTGDFFEASDIAVGVTYSIRMVDFFNFGMTCKYITQNIYNESASGVAVDFGTRLYTGYSGLVIGMSYTNFGTTMQLAGRDLRKTYDPDPNNTINTGVSTFLGTESWEMPVNFKIGIGWKAVGKENSMISSESNALQFSIDANHPNDGLEYFCLGGEYCWNNLLSIRSGYRFNDNVFSWSSGFGIHWEPSNSTKVDADFAIAKLNRLGYINTFSLSLAF